ncbi:MAG: hypothetical protein R6X32_07465, partial [Chloroflexota bacterium]
RAQDLVGDGPSVEPQAISPELRSPQIGGPQVSGPQVSGPQVSGPEMGDLPQVGQGQSGLQADTAARQASKMKADPLENNKKGSMPPTTPLPPPAAVRPLQAAPAAPHLQRAGLDELEMDQMTGAEAAAPDLNGAEPDASGGENVPAVGLEESPAVTMPEVDAATVREGVVSLYAEADLVETAVPLLIRREGEEMTFIAYVQESEIDDFLARTEEEEAGAMLVYVTAEAAGTAVDDPIPLILQQQGEEQKLLVYVAPESLEHALTQAEVAEAGAGILVYGAEEDATSLGNPVELLLKQAGEADVLVAYTDEAALAKLIETADLYEMTPVVDDLARQVYGRVRQRLLWERERMGH